MNVRKYRRSHSITLVAVVLIVALGVWRVPLINAYEDVAFRLSPSVQRAVAYGSRHLDAIQPDFHDVERAHYFYRKAAELDDTYPYVYHQLARIEFLKNNQNTALLYINREIERHGANQPNSYYIRGLIEGYRGEYEAAARDYEHFINTTPPNWAAINDYVWVLLKAERFSDAAEATAKGLIHFPDSPWLLNSHAIALAELGDAKSAHPYARRAAEAVNKLTQIDWLRAYPGNDPNVASDGVAAFQVAVQQNLSRIEQTLKAAQSQ